jgi:hypothetical protein
MEAEHEPEVTADAGEVATMLARAQAGDRSVLPQLQAFLDERPELWRQAGDVARHAREALLNLAADHNLLAKECLFRKMEELSAELAGSSPGPLERLLVERIVLTWADAPLADIEAVRHARSATPQGAHALRRQAAAGRRYHQAIRALATIRKLLKTSPSPVDLALRVVPEAPAPRRERPPLRADVLAAAN